MLKTFSAVCVLLAAFAPVPSAVAQDKAALAPAAPIKRIPLQRFDVPGTPYETVIGLAEIAPNVAIGPHTHPGPESGYLLEGSFELLIEGQPPRTLKAGESYQVPAQVIHDARTGAGGAKVIATYVVQKGHPLASPAK